MIRLLSNAARAGFFILFLLSECIIGVNALAAQLTLRWTDTSTNENGFKIERRAGSASTFAQIATVSRNVITYTNTDLPGGTTYCYRVRAYNTAGNSNYSNERCGAASTGGPVAAYGFNEGSGSTTADASGGGNTGQIVGAAWVNGKYGKALNFTGSSFVRVNGAALNNRVPFSYCAWVYPRSQGGAREGHILQKGAGAAQKRFQTSNSLVNSLSLHVDRATTAASALSNANALTLNQWQFVCGTYSETNGPCLYRNGSQLTYSSRTVGSGTTKSDAGDSLYVGNRGDRTRGWNGLIDEARIYNRVLTGSEIQTLMTMRIGAAAPSQSITQTGTPSDDGNSAMNGGMSSSLCGATCTAARHSNRGAAVATNSQQAEKIGVFRPSTSMWYLDVNGNGVLDDCSIGGCLPLGQIDESSVLGGTARLGVWDPITEQWNLDLNSSSKLDSCTEDDCVGSFGLSGDRQVIGDWTGTGQKKLGVFDQETGIWELDLNGNGVFDGCNVDACIGPFGQQGDLPVVGRW